MHQHLTDQAISFLIPLMERESEPVYLYILYMFYLFWVLASLANLHTHASWLRTSILKVIILSSEYFTTTWELIILKTQMELLLANLRNTMIS